MGDIHIFYFWIGPDPYEKSGSLRIAFMGFGVAVGRKYGAWYVAAYREWFAWRYWVHYF